MKDMVPRGTTSVVGRPSRYSSKALSRLDDRVTVEVAGIEAEAELQATRVMAVSYVAKRAMHEVAMVSQLEQQLATLVPMATSRLQAIGDMMALDAADVVSNTVRHRAGGQVMTHPTCCSGHTCDLCPTCLSGTCCLTSPNGTAAPAVISDLDTLRQAIATDQDGRSSLTDLLVAEVSASLLRQLIEAASEPVTVVQQPQAKPTHRDLNTPPPPALPAGSPSTTDLFTQTSNRKEHHHVITRPYER